jgi:hypothetical protein
MGSSQQIINKGGTELIQYIRKRTVHTNVKGPIHNQSCCATLRVVQHD